MTIATALVYLLAAILFILGLLFLSSPRAARYGHWIAAGGMVLAVGWTGVVLYRSFTSAGLAICVSGVVIGGVAGTVAARKVKMTGMPQMVALFNGVGGGAAALGPVAALLKGAGSHSELHTRLPAVFALIIGRRSFPCSIIPS